MLIEVRDIHLNVEERGSGPTLLLLHGFLGSTRTWDPVIDQLSRSHRCLLIDLPGHGGSDVPDDWTRYTMQECVEDIVVILDHSHVAQTPVLGYSMGGRIALSLAIRHSHRITGLISESANPGIESSSERVSRVEADEKLALMMEREGMAAFVDYWESLPLFASQQRLPEKTREQVRSARLKTSVTGAANSSRGLSQGRQPSLWKELERLDVPALFIAGKEDEKYATISERAARAMPDAAARIIPGAGHTVHIEQPAAFADAVLTFLSTTP